MISLVSILFQKRQTMKKTICSSQYGILLTCLFALLAIVQLYAIYSAFLACFDGYPVLSLILGVLISGIPLISTIIGTYGAVAVLDWNMLLSILLFVPILAIYLPIVFGLTFGAFWIKVKSFFEEKSIESNATGEILEDWRRSEVDRHTIELWEKEEDDADFVHTGDMCIRNGQITTKTLPDSKLTTLDRLNARKLSVLPTKEIVIYHDKEEETEFKWVKNGTVLELWEKGIHDADFVNTGDIKTDRKSSYSFSMAKSKDTTIKRLLRKLSELGLD